MFLDWIAIEIDFVVRIDKKVLHLINNFRQNSNIQNLEACGIIIGEIRAKSLWVKNISKPCSNDIQTRNTFERSILTHQNFLNKLHKQSNGTLQYIGEWHTHPEVYPKPSNKDYIGWTDLYNNGDFSKFPKIFWIASNLSYENDWLNLFINDKYFKLIMK